MKILFSSIPLSMYYYFYSFFLSKYRMTRISQKGKRVTLRTPSRCWGAESGPPCQKFEYPWHRQLKSIILTKINCRYANQKSVIVPIWRRWYRLPYMSLVARYSQSDFTWHLPSSLKCVKTVPIKTTHCNSCLMVSSAHR